MREERIWILTFSEASKLVKRKLLAPRLASWVDATLRLRYRTGSGGLSAVLTGDWSYLPSSLPSFPCRYLSIRSKHKGGARKNDDMGSNRKDIVFELGVWSRSLAFIHISCMYCTVRATPQSPHIYMHLYVSTGSSTSNHPSMCVCAPFDARLAASLRLRAAATTAVQAAGFGFSTSHPDVGAHLGSRLL
jgi:hypothetical protein